MPPFWAAQTDSESHHRVQWIFSAFISSERKQLGGKCTRVCVCVCVQSVVTEWQQQECDSVKSVRSRHLFKRRRKKAAHYVLSCSLATFFFKAVSQKLQLKTPAKTKPGIDKTGYLIVPYTYWILSFFPSRRNNVLVHFTCHFQLVVIVWESCTAKSTVTAAQLQTTIY